MLCSSTGSVTGRGGSTEQQRLHPHGSYGYPPSGQHPNPSYTVLRDFGGPSTTYHPLHPHDGGSGSNYVQDHSIHSSYPPAAPSGPHLIHPHHQTSTANGSNKSFWENPQDQRQSLHQQSTQRQSKVTVSGATSKPTSAHRNRSNRSVSAAAAAAAKKRKRVATVAQRRAANIRERRRMFNLNEAFDKLRRKVPTFAYEKRLSRIETLRLAITYIGFMDQVIRSEGKSDTAAGSNKSCGRLLQHPTASTSGGSGAEEPENGYRDSSW